MRALADAFALTDEDLEHMHTARLPRLRERPGYAIFFAFLPVMHGKRMQQTRVTFLVRKDAVATIVDEEQPTLERLSSGKPLHKRFSHGSSSAIVAWLLTEMFDDLDAQTDDMHAEIGRVEAAMRKMHPDAVTESLGTLRRNALELDLMVEPHAELVQYIIDTEAIFHGDDARELLMGLRDRLRGVHAVLSHHLKLIDSLFRMHEARLAHRTNQIVQMLTTISLLLMPPTLVTSFYGMNVAGLPWAQDIRIVGIVITAAAMVFLALVYRVYKR